MDQAQEWSLFNPNMNRKKMDEREGTQRFSEEVTVFNR